MTDQPPKTGRGGARKGSGRKAADGARFLRKCSVSLDHETIASAREMGEGDLSAGLRRAVRIAVKTQEEAS